MPTVDELLSGYARSTGTTVDDLLSRSTPPPEQAGPIQLEVRTPAGEPEGAPYPYGDPSDIEDKDPESIQALKGLTGMVPSPINVASALGKAVLPQSGSELGALVGSYIGQGMGTATGIPGAGYGGAVIGGGLGGATGVLFDIARHQAQNLARSITGSIMGSPSQAPNLQPAPTLLDDLKSIPAAASMGAQGSLYGMPAASVANYATRLLAAPFAHRVAPDMPTPFLRREQSPVAKEAAAGRQTNLEQWKAEGMPYSPGQATESPLLSGLEGAGRFFPSTAGHFGDWVHEQIAARQEGLGTWLKSVDPQAERGMRSGGERAMGSLTTSEQKARTEATRQYNLAWRVTGGKTVPVANTQKAVSLLTKEAKGQGDLATGMSSTGKSMLGQMMTLRVYANSPLKGLRTSEVMNILNDFSKQMGISYADAENMLGVVSGNEADVKALHDARSTLLEITRKASKSPRGKTPLSRDATILIGGITKDLDAVSDNPQYANFKPLLKAADRNFWQTVGKTFKDPDIIQSVWKHADQNQQDSIFDLIFRPGESTGPILAMRKAVGQQEVTRWTVTKLAHDFEAHAVENGVFSPTKAVTLLRRYTPDQLQQGLGLSHAADLEKIAKGMEQMKRSYLGGANPSFTARMMMLYHQIETIGGIGLATLMAGGQLPSGAAAKVGSLLLVPWAMSRVMLSPAGAHWLSEGFRPGLTTQEMIKLGTRIATQAQFPSEAEMPIPQDEDVKVEIPQGSTFGTSGFPER